MPVIVEQAAMVTVMLRTSASRIGCFNLRSTFAHRISDSIGLSLLDEPPLARPVERHVDEAD